MAKELYADFLKQEWLMDLAYEIGRENIRIDRLLLMEFNSDELKRIHTKVEYESELDDIAYAADLIGDGPGQHWGPFEVYIDKYDLDEFFESVGIDIEHLTEEKLAEVRARYLAENPGPSEVPTM